MNLSQEKTRSQINLTERGRAKGRKNRHGFFPRSERKKSTTIRGGVRGGANDPGPIRRYALSAFEKENRKRIRGDRKKKGRATGRWRKRPKTGFLIED